MTTIHRVDTFTVPDAARAEFWTHVRRTHDILRTQPGFLGDALLERPAGAGRHAVVTVVHWASAADIEAATSVVRRAHEAAGFVPPEFLAEAGIAATLGTYTDVRD